MYLASDSPVVNKRYSPKKSVATALRKKKFSQESSSRKRVVPIESSKKVAKIPTRSALNTPIWLRVLLLFQQSSSAIAFGLIITVFSVYALTVYTQRLWDKEYKKLKTLQRHERLLTETNETLKNELARQAEKLETGLVLTNPSKSIFLRSTQAIPISLKQARNLDPNEIISVKMVPLGY
ncbi:MAG: hypothetical protein AB4038_13250 [Prochloraceae cyanobacterium]